MGEVGLLPFARVALQVARSVLPAYRSRQAPVQPAWLLAVLRFNALINGLRRRDFCEAVPYRKY